MSLTSDIDMFCFVYGLLSREVGSFLYYSSLPPNMVVYIDLLVDLCGWWLILRNGACLATEPGGKWS